MKKLCRACKLEIEAKAIKCPKCGTDQRNWLIRHPIITILGILFILSSVISGFSKEMSSQNSKTSTTETISEEYKASLADSFCKNRSGGKKYFDLQPVAQFFDGKGNGDDLIYNTTKEPSSSDCRKVAEGCIKLWSKEECENIANKKIWIGMSELQLNLSWGNPNDKNNTTNTFGISSQWVYGDPLYGANYVYLEGKDKDSMKVTSWQD